MRKEKWADTRGIKIIFGEYIQMYGNKCKKHKRIGWFLDKLPKLKYEAIENLNTPVSRAHTRWWGGEWSLKEPLKKLLEPDGFVAWGFPGGTVVKNLPANTGAPRDMGLIPGLGRSPGEGNGKPLQYSCLENSMDRGAWQPAVREIAESDKTEHTYTHKKCSFFCHMEAFSTKFTKHLT